MGQIAGSWHAAPRAWEHAGGAVLHEHHTMARRRRRVYLRSTHRQQGRLDHTYVIMARPTS